MVSEHVWLPISWPKRMIDLFGPIAVEGITNFNFSPPTEEFTRDSFLPPPIFSRHTAPQLWE